MTSINKPIDSNKKLKQFYSANLRKIGFKQEELGSTPLLGLDYEKQLNLKLDASKQVFSNVVSSQILDNLNIEKAPNPLNYRLKMEYVCAYNPIYEPHARFGQRKTGNFSWVVDMTECNLANSNFFAKTRIVYDYLQKLGIRNYDLVKHNGNLRYITLKSHKKEAMIILTTKSEDAKTQEIIEKSLKYALRLGFKSAYWVVNPTDSDKATGTIKQFKGLEFITVKLSKTKFLIGPDTFFQNNPSAFESLITYIKTKIVNNTTTLLDLYCGIGVIGLLLAQSFKNVYGYDYSQSNVLLAKKNAIINKIDNVKFIIEDLNKVNSLKGINRAETLVVDPPREGLGSKTIELINNIAPQMLIYISCNPITQARDIKLLSPNYKPTSIKIFDLYPQTYHMESVAIFARV